MCFLSVCSCLLGAERPLFPYEGYLNVYISSLSYLFTLQSVPLGFAVGVERGIASRWCVVGIACFLSPSECLVVVEGHLAQVQIEI